MTMSTNEDDEELNVARTVIVTLVPRISEIDDQQIHIMILTLIDAVEMAMATIQLLIHLDVEAILIATMYPMALENTISIDHFAHDRLEAHRHLLDDAAVRARQRRLTQMTMNCDLSFARS